MKSTLMKIFPIVIIVVVIASFFISSFSNSPSSQNEPNKNDKSYTEEKEIKKEIQNISYYFTEELKQEWISYGFTYETCADWINIGFKPTEAEYAYWLEKEVDFEPLKYLNETSPEDQANLREQFKEWKRKNDN